MTQDIQKVLAKLQQERHDMQAEVEALRARVSGLDKAIDALLGIGEGPQRKRRDTSAWTPELRAAMAERTRQRWTPERRAAMAEQTRQRWTPERRAAMAEQTRQRWAAAREAAHVGRLASVATDTYPVQHAS